MHPPPSQLCVLVLKTKTQSKKALKCSVDLRKLSLGSLVQLIPFTIHTVIFHFVQIQTLISSALSSG